MHKSSYRRGGQAVLIACGVSISEGTLQAGLLFVSAELDPQPYKLFDVDSGEKVTVSLPDEYLDLKEDVCKRNVSLEVMPCTA